MKIPQSLTIPSPFMRNYFCKIENYNAAFVAVSKNAVTFLKKISIYTKTGQIVKTEDDAHYTIGFNEESKYLIHVSNMNNFENANGRFLKFAVWRDPVERLISTYSSSVLKESSESTSNSWIYTTTTLSNVLCKL